MNAVLVSPCLQSPVVNRLKDLVRDRPGFDDLAVATPDYAEAQCQKTGPDLILVVLSADSPDRSLNVIPRLRDFEGKHVVAVGPATDPKLILKSMQLGADLFLDQSDLESGLSAALSRLGARYNSGVTRRVGRLLAVLPTSGGCGASTLAVNIAALKAREFGRCHLIDLNSGKADLAPLLDVTPQYTMADLCQNEARLDRAMYEKLITRHPCGVSLLAAPRELGHAKLVTTRGVSQAVDLARDLFPEVVVDMEDCFHEEQTLVLHRATDILLVCRLDFTAVRNVRRTLDHLAAIGVSRQRVRVVANHYGRPNELPLEDAEAAVGEKLTLFVPHDPAVICSANNSGVPAVLHAPAAKVVARIADLAGLPPKKPAKPKSGIVPALRSLFQPTN